MTHSYLSCKFCGAHKFGTLVKQVLASGLIICDGVACWLGWFWPFGRFETKRAKIDF